MSEEKQNTQMEESNESTALTTRTKTELVSTTTEEQTLETESILNAKIQECIAKDEPEEAEKWLAVRQRSILGRDWKARDRRNDLYIRFSVAIFFLGGCLAAFLGQNELALGLWSLIAPTLVGGK